jgi:hypothetical protein
MEQSWNPETKEQLCKAVDTLLHQSNKNGVTIEESAVCTLACDETNTPNWEVHIHRVQD